MDRFRFVFQTFSLTKKIGVATVIVFNPLMPTGIVHPYQLDLSIFSSRGVR